MVEATQNTRTQYFISNRWVNSIYTGYGVTKQRILLQIIQDMQQQVNQVMNGQPVPKLPQDNYVYIDMSKVVHYNNYHYLKSCIKEMCEQPIQIYNDPEFKKDIYFGQTLLDGFDIVYDKNGKLVKNMIALRIKKNIAELLLHVNYGYTKKSPHKKTAYQFTKFDPFTMDKIHGACKHRLPLYLMLCSYGEKGGFEMSVDELRSHLDVENEYKGFDNFNRYILQRVQKQLNIFGAYSFNYSLVKTGRTVKKVVFKVFSNAKYDPNHVWIRLQKALTTDLPYFARFTDEQREQFNYLLDSKQDLDKVLAKFEYIHKYLVKNKGKNTDKPAVSFAYTLNAIKHEFPPG